MLAIGLDVHQKRTAVAILDSDSGEVRERKVSTLDVAEFLEELKGYKRVVLETGYMSAFLARKLGSLAMDVLLVDAFKSHRFAEAMNTAKTDRLDALALAHLAHQGAEELAVWVPDVGGYSQPRSSPRSVIVDASPMLATCGALRAWYLVCTRVGNDSTQGG